LLCLSSTIGLLDTFHDRELCILAFVLPHCKGTFQDSRMENYCPAFSRKIETTLWGACVGVKCEQCQNDDGKLQGYVSVQKAVDIT
jgi:hypothetical protein